jgi:hypothetical protein
MAPTSYEFETKTVVEIKADVTYHTTKNDFDNDPAAQEASTAAFKKSLNQTNAKVEIDDTTTEFYDDGTRRRLALVEGLKVTYLTTIIAELTGLNATELFKEIASTITEAVSSGTFEANLLEAFEEFDVTNTFASEDTITLAAPVVTDLIQPPTSEPSSMPTTPGPTLSPTEEPITPFPTREPTPAPSSQPTHSPTFEPTVLTTTLGSSDDSSFSTVNIIIIAVVVPVGILLCVAVAYFVNQRKEKNFNIVPSNALPVGLNQ